MADELLRPGIVDQIRAIVREELRRACDENAMFESDKRQRHEAEIIRDRSKELARAVMEAGEGLG
jgi:hypothetical protein